MVSNKLFTKMISELETLSKFSTELIFQSTE